LMAVIIGSAVSVLVRACACALQLPFFTGAIATAGATAGATAATVTVTCSKKKQVLFASLA
jgi:hypothetical protein